MKQDDNEFARYLASYLQENEEKYLVEYSYPAHAEIDKEQLEICIKIFLESLP